MRAFSALTLAQRSFCAATIEARPAADIPPFFFLRVGAGAEVDAPLTLAQRACCAARMLAKPSADNLPFFFLPRFAGAAETVTCELPALLEPKMSANSA